MATMTSFLLGRRLVPVLLLTCLIGPAGAEEIVFTNGKRLRVEQVRLEGDTLWARLPGGGDVGFSALRVQEVLPDPLRPTEPASVIAMAVRRRLADPTDLDQVVDDAARRHGVDAKLVRAVIQVESAWDIRAVSPKGAMGLMQLMPSTAAGLGVTDPFDPIQNIEAGTAHIADLLEDHGGEVSMALAAYNAGEGAVARYAGIPPYRETMSYVRKVLNLYYEEPVGSAR